MHLYLLCLQLFKYFQQLLYLEWWPKEFPLIGMSTLFYIPFIWNTSCFWQQGHISHVSTPWNYSNFSSSSCEKRWKEKESSFVNWKDWRNTLFYSLILFLFRLLSFRVVKRKCEIVRTRDQTMLNNILIQRISQQGNKFHYLKII